MAEHIVADVDDLAPGERLITEVGGLTIGVFNIRGDYYALPNLCPHQYGPLCEGSLSSALMSREETDYELTFEFEGEVVKCPWHGLEFHVPTGECLTLEHEFDPLPVEIRDGQIVVTR